MSRKQPSFAQLISYIDRDEGQEAWRIRHNVFARDPMRIREEFQRNGSLLSRRKNGVYLYHEILSITRAEGLSPDEQKRRLRDIAEIYVASRCPDNLVYGGLHQDKAHSYHYHLMISANRAGESKRLRLSKAQFRNIQMQIERHVLEQYPELEQKVAMDKRSERGRSKSEAELERRTGSRPKREAVLDRVRAAYGASSDRESLFDALGREGLELYVRGKHLGVVDLESGKKHRLKTLDAEMADQVALRMEAVAERAQEDAPEIQASRAERASAGEKEKTPEAAQEPSQDKQKSQQNQTSREEEPMREPNRNAKPERPDPQRQEDIDKGYVEADPERDVMSHEDWRKEDRFLTKVQKSWRRTMDDIRGRKNAGRDREDGGRDA